LSAVSGLFGIGISGPELTESESGILRKSPPWAVILFRRNIESAEQLDRLVEDLRRLPGPPLLCVDQEGGPVDRFRDLLGASISLRAAAERGEARRAGELAGEACARFGIAVDLAPVVDRSIPGAPGSVLGERAAAEDPETVARVAEEFLDGLHARGVGGCLKHFPGLGRANLDTHVALPVVVENAAEEARDLFPYERVMAKAGAVMVSHVAGEDGVPASLSRARATGFLRDRLGFSGAAFSDDLEMGALWAFGDLPERCVAASNAGCDLLFVCKEIEAFSDCVRAVERDVPALRQQEAHTRLERYETHLAEISAFRTSAPRPLGEMAADIRNLRMGVRGIERSPA
jgi:beta-N-acetylhexosaminidase